MGTPDTHSRRHASRRDHTRRAPVRFRLHFACDTLGDTLGMCPSTIPSPVTLALSQISRYHPSSKLAISHCSGAPLDAHLQKAPAEFDSTPATASHHTTTSPAPTWRPLSCRRWLRSCLPAFIVAPVSAHKPAATHVRHRALQSERFCRNGGCHTSRPSAACACCSPISSGPQQRPHCQPPQLLARFSGGGLHGLVTVLGRAWPRA